MTERSPREFSVDRVSVALIATVGVVVTPGLILATSVGLLRAVDFDAVDGGAAASLAVAVSSLFVALVMIRASARELGGALLVRIDEGGIARGRVRLDWSEVTELRAPRYGQLEIVAGERRILLQTYLFSERRALLTAIAERTGLPAPEMGTSG